VPEEGKGVDIQVTVVFHLFDADIPQGMTAETARQRILRNMEARLSEPSAAWPELPSFEIRGRARYAYQPADGDPAIRACADSRRDTA
jgi:hypothetical protein